MIPPASRRGLTLRARIVLTIEGKSKVNTAIAAALGIDRNTVNKWRSRCARDRIAGTFVSRYSEDCKPFQLGRTANPILEKPGLPLQTNNWDRTRADR